MINNNNSFTWSKYLIASFAITLSALYLFSINFKQNSSKYPISQGDILFQDLDCGPLCDAIEDVTFGLDSSRFSHIGFVVLENGELKVLEAIGQGVILSPVDEFLKRSLDESGNPKIWVAKLKPDFIDVLNKALDGYQSYLGIEYDDEFLCDNSKYYCSELIYDLFAKSNGDKAFFDLEPMTFKSFGSQEFNPVWVEYYSDLNIDIPEGEPGINPAGISRSGKITVVSKLGKVQMH